MPSDARVLALLQEAGAGGISTGEFMEARIGRAGSAILALRQRGYSIEGIPIERKRPRGAQRYYLRAEPAVTREESEPASPSFAGPDAPEPVIPAAGSGRLFDAAAFGPGMADA